MLEWQSAPGVSVSAPPRLGRYPTGYSPHRSHKGQICVKYKSRYLEVQQLLPEKQQILQGILITVRLCHSREKAPTLERAQPLPVLTQFSVDG